MGNISLQTILFWLGPSSGNPFFNILLYIIFFGALITLFRMPDKNLLPTLLIATVLLTSVIVKINTSVRPPVQPILEEKEFGAFILNVILLTFPLLTAGLIRTRQKKGGVVAPALVTALFGGVFFFMFWFIVQRS